MICRNQPEWNFSCKYSMTLWLIPLPAGMFCTCLFFVLDAVWTHGKKCYFPQTACSLNRHWWGGKQLAKTSNLVGEVGVEPQSPNPMLKPVGHTFNEKNGGSRKLEERLLLFSPHPPLRSLSCLSSLTPDPGVCWCTSVTLAVNSGRPSNPFLRVGPSSSPSLCYCHVTV